MSSIISYLVSKRPIEIANPEFADSTSHAIFYYTISDSPEFFHYFYNSNSPFHNFLLPMVIFTPLSLTFETNQPIQQQFLTHISRIPTYLHSKNPFISVTFSRHNDPNRLWCSPTDITNPQRVTLFDNPTVFTLPPPSVLFTEPPSSFFVQFTHLANDKHSSYRFPRIKALKLDNNVLIPLSSITNGLTTPTIQSIKDLFDIRLFINFDDSECISVAPCLEPQECINLGLHNVSSDSIPSTTLDYMFDKISNTQRNPDRSEAQKSNLTRHMDRLTHLKNGLGSILIHSDRIPQINRARAVAIGRAFANRAKPISTFVLIPLHAPTQRPWPPISTRFSPQFNTPTISDFFSPPYPPPYTILRPDLSNPMEILSDLQ